MAEISVGVDRTVFSASDEEWLAEWIKESTRRGSRYTMTQVREVVQKILNEQGVTTVFKENLPGRKWMSLFLKRHPDINLFLDKSQKTKSEATRNKIKAAAKHSSGIWRHVTLDSTDTSYVICNHCGLRLRYNNSSTSNVKKHLTRKHMYNHNSTSHIVKATSSAQSDSPEVKPKIETSLVQPTVVASVERPKTHQQSSEKKRHLDTLLMAMVAKDIQPFSIVEDDGFKDFVKALDARYQLPSRQQLSRELLPHLYEEKRLKVLSILASVSHIAITTDLWTSRSNEAYITLTAHFVNAEFKLTTLVLSTVHVANDHTAKTIAVEMDSVFQRWDIQSKVQAIVTDNVSNLTSVVTQEMQIRNVECFAHTLNMIVQDSIKKMEELDETSRKVKAIVTFFRHSTKASYRLKEEQKAASVQEKKLVQDEERRWNSTAAMMQRYCEQHELVSATLCNLGKQDLCVSDQDVQNMRKALDVLEPFRLVSEEMSSETHVTLSKMIPFVRLLQKSLKNSSEPDCPLAKELLNQLSGSYPDLENNSLVSIATFLDPRFKSLHFVDQNAVAKTKEGIREFLKTQYNEERASVSPPESECVEPPKKKSIWDSHDEDVDQLLVKAPTQITGPEIEMRRYMESSYVKRQENPLTWWKDNQTMLPHLSKLASKVLGIPATSVPSDRIFSKAGELLAARRSMIKDTHVDQLLFLNKNC